MVPTKSAAEWTSFQSNPNGMTLSTCACTFSTWTAIGPTGKYWSILGVSENGQILAAIDTEPTLNIDDNETGQIWISTNGGANWTARGGATMIVSDFDMSDDGTVMAFVGTDNGYPGYYNNFFVSTNSGTSWTKRTNVAAALGVAVSGDGATIAIAEYLNDGHIRTSTNNGSTWTSRNSTGSFNDVSLAETGSKIVAASSRIYTSTNSGSSWTARAATSYWSGSEISSDGTVIMGQSLDYEDSTNSGTYISTNSGSTFTRIQKPALAFYAQKPSMSMDGSTIATTFVTYNPDYSVATNNVRFSVNSGSNWTNRHPINDTSRALGATRVSGDGQIVYTYLHGTLSSDGYLPNPGRLYKSNCN